LRATQRRLYRHIKTLIALGKLVFEVKVPTSPRFPVAPRPPLRGASRRDAASAFLVTLLIEKQM